MIRLAAAALVLAGLAGGPATARPARCRHEAAPLPVRLPATVVVHTTCGSFGIRPDGTIDRGAAAAGAWPSWAPPGSSQPFPGVFVGRADGRIVVRERGGVVWRSSPGHRVANLAVGARAIAFSDAGGRLYAARRGEPERPIARGEAPLGFTRAGLLVTARNGPEGAGRLRLRRLDGKLVGVLLRSPRAVAFEPRTGRLFAIDRQGTLMRFDGLRRADLGVPRYRPGSDWLQPLEGDLVAMYGTRGIVIVDRRGAVFARVRFRPYAPGRDGRTINGDALVPAPGGAAVAYASLRRSGATAVRGVALVSVLGRGDRRERVLARHRVERLGCAYDGHVTWHSRGRWLLYVSGDRRIFVLDGRGRRRPVELSRLVHTLPGRRGADARPVAFWADWGAG